MHSNNIKDMVMLEKNKDYSTNELSADDSESLDTTDIQKQEILALFHKNSKKRKAA